MFDEKNLKTASKYAQMHIVQLGLASLVSLALGFFTFKSCSEPCVREVVCKEIIRDRDKLSDQISGMREECLTEKAQLGKTLKDKFVTDCNDRVKKAIKNCDFSEEHHCPICKARGVCK